MRKLLLLGMFAAVFFGAARAQKEVVVDPNASVRTIGAGFQRIKVSHNIKLVLSQANHVTMAVSASEEKYKENIKTLVENNTLRIFSDGEKWSASKNRQLTVYLSFKELAGIEISGAAQVQVVNAIRLNSLEINMSGASTFRGGLELQSLSMQLSGASKARLSGSVNTLAIECSGASDVGAYELKTQTCSATVSGASDIQLSVAKELSAEASGASRIYYKGEAITNIKSSGVSKVEKRI